MYHSMIVGRSARCISLRAVPLARFQPCRVRSRRLTSSASGAGATTTSPNVHAPVLATRALTDELDRLAPRFDIEASQIEILRSPSEFYETLKAKILNAKSRIYLSTLYIGKTEHELISVIRRALASQPTLKVSFLTDALRGTRESPEPSCASLLAPLVSEFGEDRVEIRMFHTPNLTGLRKRLIPKRINEGWGLQHMKLYGIDDEIIISGANLSNDYFTNRQDRYHIFSSKAITDYFFNIHSTICKLSFLVQPLHNPTFSPSPTTSATPYTLEWPSSNLAPSPLTSSTAQSTFISKASSLLAPLIRPPKTLPPPAPTSTSIYPLAQFTPIAPSPTADPSTELPTLLHLLRLLNTPTFNHSSWMFIAGYFNPHPSISSLLLAPSPASNIHGTVITASPWANGFFGSRGVSGLLPAAYTLLSRRFVDSVHRRGLDDNIKLREWRKGTVGQPGGWTYHAKGLWVTLPKEERVGPSVTLVGSSNYTKRSYGLDLEMNTLVVTRDEGLKRRLREEQEWLVRDSEVVGRDDLMRVERRVGLKVRIAMWIVKILGGEL